MVKLAIPPTHPKALGYFFPAEWHEHEATWLSWPHKKETWPGKLSSIYSTYAKFVKLLAESEKVRINVGSQALKDSAIQHLQKVGTNLSKVEFFFNPTNDAWCRDHGPAFLINPNAQDKKLIVDWRFNAWGGKYVPYNLDDAIPTRIANYYKLPVFHPEIIMEGGSVEFNGQGTVLSSTCCLLNVNRNPHLNKSDVENYLAAYYGIEQVLWVDDGIAGDDTDGHIDDTIRFVNEDTVVCAIETNAKDVNYLPLKKNLDTLKKMRLLSKKQLNVVELPMPDPVIYDGMRLPASYANFYIANKYVIVPTYRSPKDQKAIDIISSFFPQRHTVGLDSTDIIWGLGSFHCLTQQEPLV